MQYVEWDLNEHFKDGILGALRKAERKKVPKNLEILPLALDRMLPTETYTIHLGDYVKLVEKMGDLDRFASNHDLPLDKAKKLFIHMTQKGFLKHERRMFYETLIYDVLILFAHDVYPSSIFGGDDVVGALAIDSFEPKEIENYRFLGKLYDKLELDTTIFYNLPMDGNVWSFTLRKVNPYRDVGFCYSFEKSGNHHFISPNELELALNNIVEIRNLWIQHINNFYVNERAFLSWAKI
ncbi:MAG: hypothetical protein QXO95_01380 [Candidatus Aenigmatarchaeota archaeon]